MFLASSPAFVVALSMIPTIASAAAPQDRAAPTAKSGSAPKTAPAIPDGADRAVRAALAAAPGSALESVETPSHPSASAAPNATFGRSTSAPAA